jgi:ligand-binding SRPBCC domain-containing protein
MAMLEIETLIDAPAATCFDLLRDPRVQPAIMEIHGHSGVGQIVTFAIARRLRLTVEVTNYQRPRKLVDTMIKGPFRAFVHIHEFRDEQEGTRMVDTVEWTSPFGVAGKIFDTFVLQNYMRRVITSRNTKLKHLAENNGI